MVLTDENECILLNQFNLFMQYLFHNVFYFNKNRSLNVEDQSISSTETSIKVSFLYLFPAPVCAI